MWWLSTKRSGFTRHGLARAHPARRASHARGGLTSNLGEVEAVRLMQAGALGLVTSPPLWSSSWSVPARWLRAAAGYSPAWLHGLRPAQSQGRELQVLELVEQGLRNKEIAGVLGIQAGTVKIHLKHIFEKTGNSRPPRPGAVRTTRRTYRRCRPCKPRGSRHA